MKLYKNIIIILVILGALIGGLFLVKMLPEKDENSTNTQNMSSIEYIDILRMNSSDITKIQLESSKNSYTVIKNGNELSLSDSSNVKIDKKALETFVNSCSYIYAEKLASEKAEDAEIYGFSNPKATIMISLKDGTIKTVYIGNETIDGSGNYIKLSDENKIYIKSAYGISSLTPDYISFVDKNVLTINPTEYETLSNISIAKTGNTSIELKSFTEEDGDKKNILWKMVKPVYAEANSLVLSNDVLTPLETFTASGVVEAKPKDLSKYGINTPYAILFISAEGLTQKLTFGKEVDGYRFFTVDNYASVYMAPTQSLSFLDVAYIDLMSRLVHLENIKNISTVDIKSADKSFNLKISGDESYINGQKIDKDIFKKIYQNIISISFDSVDINAKAKNTPDVSIKYTRNDGSSCTVSFISVNERNYLALVDGKGNSIVSKKSVRDVIEFIEEKLN